MKILILERPAIGWRASERWTRNVHVARTLAGKIPSADVTLALGGTLLSERERDGFQLRSWQSHELAGLIGAHDIVISDRIPALHAMRNPQVRFVYDYFEPAFSDWMAIADTLPSRVRGGHVELKQRDLCMTLAFADFTLCVNERTRDLCVGMLQSIGLISTGAYDRDTSLGDIVSIAPFGAVEVDVPGGSTPHAGAPGGDVMMLWNAPLVYPYDPAAAVRALHRLLPTQPGLKLTFAPPRTWDRGAFPRQSDEVDPAAAIHDLARELGVDDRITVVDGMHVGDRDIEALLAAADLAVSASADSVEARYCAHAHASDLIGAALPVVCTGGDGLSAAVERDRFGVVVPGTDLDALVHAIDGLARDESARAELRARARQVRARNTWEAALQPLIAYCQEARPPAVSRGERALPLATQVFRYATASLRQRARLAIGI
jgi:glycosyltransferase involved in cell wall biosynthesis